MMQMQDASRVMESLKLIVEASGISSEDRSKLTALLQNQENQEDDSTSEDEEDSKAFGSAPDPAAYENKSGGIVDVLNDLLDKAEASLAEARKKEAVSKNNYELLKQSLEDAMRLAKSEMDKSKKRKAEAQETQATAEGDLAITMKELGEDMVQLSEIHHECMTKASDFEMETQSRAEELKALATAKKIIIEQVALTQVPTQSPDQSSDDDQPSFLQVAAK